MKLTGISRSSRRIIGSSSTVSCYSTSNAVLSAISSPLSSPSYAGIVRSSNMRRENMNVRGVAADGSVRHFTSSMTSFTVVS